MNNDVPRRPCSSVAQVVVFCDLCLPGRANQPYLFPTPYVRILNNR